MSVKSLLEALLVPPASLLYPLIAGLLLGRRRAGTTLLILGVCGLTVLAMPVSGGLMLRALERGLPLRPPPGAEPAAIVILSGDEGHGDGDEPETLSVGPLSLERLRRGALLHRRTGLPILISGGPLHPGEEPLSSILSRSLQQDFGVPVRWTEARSHDTWQNARDSAGVLKDAGISSIWLVTHGWHMRRALIAFERFGIAATAAPVRLDRSPGWTLYEFTPTIFGWISSYYGIHEWIGCAYYTLR